MNFACGRQEVRYVSLGNIAVTYIGLHTNIHMYIFLIYFTAECELGDM